MFATETAVGQNRVTASQCATPAPYGVQSALRDLNAQIEEAENLSDNVRTVLGISNPPTAKGEQNSTLADVLRSFTNRLAEANAKQREVLEHLSS